MHKPDNKLEILKQLYSDLSDECKQEFLRAIVENSTDPLPDNDGEKVSLDEFLRTRKYENGGPSTCRSVAAHISSRTVLRAASQGTCAGNVEKLSVTRRTPSSNPPRRAWTFGICISSA